MMYKSYAEAMAAIERVVADNAWHSILVSELRPGMAVRLEYRVYDVTILGDSWTRIETVRGRFEGFDTKDGVVIAVIRSPFGPAGKLSHLVRIPTGTISSTSYLR